MAPRAVGLYPADIQSDPKFCDQLAKQPNAAELMGHFNVVVAGDNAVEAVVALSDTGKYVAVDVQSLSSGGKEVAAADEDDENDDTRGRTSW